MTETSSRTMETLGPRLPPLQKTEFYSIGKANIDNSLTFQKGNKGFTDTAANIYERNYLKSNLVIDKEPHFLTSNNVFYKKPNPINETNNYLNPISSINKGERPKNSYDLLNTRLFNTYRSKNFASSNIDNPLNNSSGGFVSINEFQMRKDNSFEAGNMRSSTVDHSIKLEDKPLTFDKNHKAVFKYPKGYFVEKQEKQTRTKISEGSPDWFHVVNDRKMKEFNEKIAKEETLFIVSRYQSWITVTPKHKNRKRPLEKLKVANMEETSKVMPNWMQIKHINKPEEFLKSKDYKKQRIGEKEKKFTILVDKDQNNKSIFSIGDFRHNVASKEKADLYSSHVSQMPKEFLTWRDDKVFDPNFKTDVAKNKIEKFMKSKDEAKEKYEKRFVQKKNFNI